MVGVMGQVFWW